MLFRKIRKNRSDAKSVKQAKKLYEQYKKECQYSLVRTGTGNWWVSCLYVLAEEGKIRRDEAFAITEECKRQDHEGPEDAPDPPSDLIG